MAEFDVRPHPRGRLGAKVLVFRSSTAVRRYWRNGITTGDPGRDCLGIVNEFGATRDGVRRVDPRYFCLVGLIVGHLTADTIVHEAVHVAGCYARRVKRNTFGRGCDTDEEQIAYPTGRITNGIAWNLKRLGL